MVFLRNDTSSGVTSGRRSIYGRIYDGVRADILSGALAPGMRLPSSRALAAEAGVSRNSVLAAYDQLAAEGYIEARRGSGTRVAAALPDEMPSPAKGAAAEAAAEAAASKAASSAATKPRLSVYARRTSEAPGELPGMAPKPLRYDFRYGVPPTDDFPFDLWRKIIAARLRRMARPDMQYAPPEGFGPLRGEIAAYLNRHRGVRCESDQIIVVSGSQQALDLTARMLLDPGDGVLIEEPHYLGARHVFLAAGARLIPAPVDGDGLDVTKAPPAAARTRLAYATPSHQFPGGAVMPLARRLDLLAWAGRRDAYIVEDDYDSEYRYGGKPVEAIQGLDRSGRVIYMGTFSKTVFPSLRVGYLVLPPELVGPFRRAKWLADRHTPLLEQQALADFIAGGHYERHLRRTRQRLSARRGALLEALQEFLGDSATLQGENAGLHLLLWLKGVSAESLDGLIERAAMEGVGIYSALPYYLEPPPRAGLIVGFAALGERDIRAGVRRLARVMESYGGE